MINELEGRRGRVETGPTGSMPEPRSAPNAQMEVNTKTVEVFTEKRRWTKGKGKRRVRRDRVQKRILLGECEHGRKREDGRRFLDTQVRGRAMQFGGREHKRKERNGPLGIVVNLWGASRERENKG